MWVFAEKGFVSIVGHRDDKRFLLVRGRFRGDIEALFAEAKVEETPAADYRFRARVSRTYVATRLRELAEEIDYGNYKASIPLEEIVRSAAYHAVWNVMATAQERALALEPLPTRPARAKGPRAQRRAKRKRKPARLLGGLR